MLSAGPVERHGCPVGDLNTVVLHVIDQAKIGECLGLTGLDAPTCKVPIEGAKVKVFGRNLFGGLVIATLNGGSTTLDKNPDGSLYADIFESPKASDSSLGANFGFVDTDGNGLGDLASSTRTASDSDWTIDLCAEVPPGYQIVGVIDENGDLLTTTQCVQTIVANETLVAFEVVGLESPPPY